MLIIPPIKYFCDKSMKISARMLFILLSQSRTMGNVESRRSPHSPCTPPPFLSCSSQPPLPLLAHTTIMAPSSSPIPLHTTTIYKAARTRTSSTFNAFFLPLSRDGFLATLTADAIFFLKGDQMDLSAARSSYTAKG